MTKLIEPRSLSADGDVEVLLRGAWPDQAQVSWLPAAIAGLQPLTSAGYDDEPAHMRVARGLVGELSGHASATVALSRFFAATLQESPASFVPDLRRRVELARSHGIDFEAELGKAARVWPGRSLQEIARDLAALGAVDPSSMIDWTRLEASPPERGAYPKRGRQHEEQRDPSTVTFWLSAAPLQSLDGLLRWLKALDDARLARGAHGALWAIGVWRDAPGEDKPYYPTNYAGTSVQPAGAEMLARLYVRGKANAGLYDESLWAEALLRSWWIAFDGRELETPERERKDLIAIAKREIGRVRVRVRNSDAVTAGVLIDDESDHLAAASRVLFKLGTLWDGMKALLLLVRAMPTPVFAEDLSWWSADAPPARTRGVAALASDLMFSFQAFARVEQEGDKELTALRESFSDFCLERLKSRPVKKKPDAGKGADADEAAGEMLIEPNPVWREAAIRAAVELGMNPGGSGHRILHHAIDNDPDPDVRTAAKAAYPAFRGGRGLSSTTSPRRAVLAALWWLRQAQLRALGSPIDEKGALKTRSDEVRRTTPAFQKD